MTSAKDTYLRILISGPRGEEDWGAAAQLISEGYAGSSFRRDTSRAQGGIAMLYWQGTTIRGNIWADELAQQTRKAKLKALAAKAIIAVISAAFGIAVMLLQKQITGC